MRRPSSEDATADRRRQEAEVPAVGGRKGVAMKDESRLLVCIFSLVSFVNIQLFSFSRSKKRESTE